jgi:hypothetical protein
LHIKQVISELQTWMNEVDARIGLEDQDNQEIVNMIDTEPLLSLQNVKSTTDVPVATWLKFLEATELFSTDISPRLLVKVERNLGVQVNRDDFTVYTQPPKSLPPFHFDLTPLANGKHISSFIPLYCLIALSRLESNQTSKGNAICFYCGSFSHVFTRFHRLNLTPSRLRYVFVSKEPNGRCSTKRHRRAPRVVKPGRGYHFYWNTLKTTSNSSHDPPQGLLVCLEAWAPSMNVLRGADTKPPHRAGRRESLGKAC